MIFIARRGDLGDGGVLRYIRDDLDLMGHTDNVVMSFRLSHSGLKRIPACWSRILSDRDSRGNKVFTIRNELGRSPNGYPLRVAHRHFIEDGVTVVIGLDFCRISLAKAVANSAITKRKYFTLFIDRLEWLFQNGYLGSDWKSARQHAYAVMRSRRGTITTEYAIDIEGLETSAEARYVSKTMKRYARRGFTRLEVVFPVEKSETKVYTFNPVWEKTVKSRMSRLIKKTLTRDEIASVFGLRLSQKNKLVANRQLNRAIQQIISERDFSVCLTSDELKIFRGLERQNMV